MIRITGATITPVAFDDPPLLNAVGVHQPYALRAIVQLHTDAGLVGLGETYADEAHLRRLAGAAGAIAGLDVFEYEPKVGSDLRKLNNVVLTPHIAGGTAEAQHGLASLAADNLIAALGFGPQAGKPRSVFNPEVDQGS